MPLPGGPSDKYGNRFEGKWTAYCIAQVMAEEADSISLEPLGTEGEGVEFTLRRGDDVEYHQVKRQHSRSGDWSIPELASNGILRNAFLKTRDSTGQYVFVSTTSTMTLATLVDDALHTESLACFKEHFLKSEKKTRDWGVLISTLCDIDKGEEHKVGDALPQDDESLHECIVYEQIKRIHIRTLDEDTLTEMVENKLRTLVRSDVTAVRHALCEMALESIHSTLYADDIWSYIEGLGHKRVDYARDTSVLAAVEELNSRYESMIKGIGCGITIPRDEVSAIMDILKGNDRKTSVLVSGEAGVGKTCVLGQAIHKLKSEGTPHLYFRVDRLDPTDLPTKVSAQLRLPATPAEVLVGIARGRSCVLIVDQLDAVSFASGRNPEFFDCVYDIIRQADAYPNVRLLLACRRFDIERDRRLRELVSEKGLAHEVSVKPFTSDSVKDVLMQLGCNPSDYNNRQIELLRLPLHLALFAEVIHEPRVAPFVFASSIDIFNAFWEQKRRAVSDRIGMGEDHWIHVLDCLCDRMTERQTLFAQEAEVLDEYERTVRAMESENILVLEKGNIGFFHEGFFDYVFARRFTARGSDLIKYLKEGEQGLFKRSPLRQILLHSYATDPMQFVSELRRVILDSSIRYHLRRCALEVAGRIDCATPELWELFQETFVSADCALIREVWRVIWTASTWFLFLYEKGFIASWLPSKDSELRERAVKTVYSHIGTYPGDCVNLLSPYIGVSDEWDKVILHIIWQRLLLTDRRVFNLFMSMLEAGEITSQGHTNFWTAIYDLPKSQPDWAAEALGQHLRTAITGIRFDVFKMQLLPNDGSGVQLVKEIAEGAPLTFLEQVIPVFLEVVQRSGRDRDGKLIIDPVWFLRTYLDQFPSIEAALLQGMEDAFTALAGNSIPDFTRCIDKLLPYGDYDSVNFLIVRALSAAPLQFADATVEYLLSNPQRLECGWSSGGDGDFTYWAARELVAHVSPNCSDDYFERLEAHMVDYFPRNELVKDGFKRNGYWQIIMLPALPVSRRGPRAETRLREWDRKFRGIEIKPPIAVTSGCIGSPIKTEAIPLMKDADWLKALEVYDTEGASRRRPRSFLEGGALQLSGVLETETKRDPVRFARLSERFPANTHRYYFHSLLRGLKDSEADKDTVLDVVRRVFSLPGKPGHRYLCDAIAKFNAEHLPDDILAIVGWSATEADDPESEDLTMFNSDSEVDNRPHAILTTAINSVRGAAAETVGSLLFDHPERIAFFMPYLEKMVNDPTVIVRTTVANTLLCLYKHDEACAVDLFLTLVEIDNDLLLATHHVDRFLHYANIRHFKRLRPVLRRMLNSQIPAVRETGARQACLAQFNNPDAADMVAECVSGDEAQRMGAAKVAEANLFNLKCAEYSNTTLPIFFNDPVKTIRDEAARCFHNAEGRDLENAKLIIRDFLDSIAFGENIEDLMWPLLHSTADIAEEVLLTCEAVIVRMESLGDDVTQHRLYSQADNVATLVLRTYRQTAAPAIRNRCLDIVDHLLAQEVYGMLKELDQFER